MKKINIFGFGGHAAVVSDTCLALGFQAAVFFEEKGLMATSPAPAGEKILVGRSEAFPLQEWAPRVFALGLGDNEARLWWGERLLSDGFELPPIVHPRAWVSPSAILAEGVFVGAGAVIQAGAKIGRACLINSNATVEHHCEIKAGAHIGPGAVLAGLAKVGEKTMVGAGAVIRDRIRVGKNATVGAGAAVVSHVSPGIVVTGVPAKPLS